MSFFDNLFGKKPHPAKPAPISPASLDPAKNKDLIRVYDAYGRELSVTRRQWQENVLPGTLKNAWDKPDQLYDIIISALTDGFHSSVIEATEHLYKIDSDHTRAACVWGIVLMEENRLDAAEKVFRDFLARHGENGLILTNLAKVFSKRKNNAKAEEILWHALEIDPNQDNGMAWYQSIHRERGGPQAGLEALKRIALVPGSWRAELWLARAALDAKQLKRAIDYYQEALAHAPRPVPTDLLRQMSGNLGNHDHLPELLAMTEPLFDVNLHGLEVGSNLIKAHLDSGHLDAAREIMDQLYALNRPDWKHNLSFWDTEIARARVATAPIDGDELPKMAVINMQNPIWLPDDSPACKLFPKKPKDELMISFLGSSAETGNPSQAIQRQLADTPGRISRALPLFLTEQVFFGSYARVQTLTPWLVGRDAGFVLSEKAWSDQDAAIYARQSRPRGDFIVTTHLLAQTDPWTAQLRLVRVVDEICLMTVETTFAPTSPQEGFLQLVAGLLAAISKHAGVRLNSFPSLYQVPSAQAFPFYLLRLEQLLAVRLSSMEGVGPVFLNGEREIIDGNIQLCLACGGNPIPWLVLAQTLVAMKKTRADILPEYQEKLALLLKEKSMDAMARKIVQRIIGAKE